MSGTASLIASVTGLIATIYIFIKAIKKFNSPCFSITVDDSTEDLTLMRYLAYKMTPRKRDSGPEPSEVYIPDNVKPPDAPELPV